VNVLLLNPEDTPWSGDWREQSWDVIVDLGWAGPDCYRRWSQELKTRVFSLFDLQEPLEIYREVGEQIAAGRNRVVDSFGLDWWELQAAVAYQQFQMGILLKRLLAEIGPDADLCFSSPSPAVKAASRVWRREIPVLQSTTRSSNLGSFARRAWRLTPSQSLEIAFDKWDPDYKLRRFGARNQRAHTSEPVVLLPSPYVNVSRAVLEYAKLLPKRRFLLAATRNSGSWSLPLENLSCTSLAAYADRNPGRNSELESLLEKWRHLESDFTASAPEVVSACGPLFQTFATTLRPLLAVRDAWWRLLNAEPVVAVLCADDLNTGTRIPLILARQLGLSTFYCAHGALDVSLIFKQSYAGQYLARGPMEHDFMVACGIAQERIVVGAATPSPVLASKIANQDPKASIVFFSQPYEVYGGRAVEAYREILPPLCDIARQHNRKVVVKLHPFESRRERSRLIRSVLSSSQLSCVEISNRRFASELFGEMWFGVSVNSSVAVECTLHGIPFFNCGWLEPKDAGYAKQFSKFSAGQLLQTASDINSIPERVAEFYVVPEVLAKISQPIQPARLDQVMFGERNSLSALPAPKGRPRALGRILRNVIYPSLSATRYLRRRRHESPNTLAVLTYHGVFPPAYHAHDSFFDDAMIEADVFRRQLRFLKQNYCLITPEDCRQWLMGGLRLPAGAVLLTCDDGLLNNLTCMLPVLLEENVKCLFFVTGYSLTETPKLPWYFQLFFLLMSAPAGPLKVDFDSISITLSLRSRGEREASWWRLARELSKQDECARSAFLEHVASIAGLPPGSDGKLWEKIGLRERYLPLASSGVRQLVASGMSVGGHTLTHPVLSWATSELSRKEILEGRNALEQLIGTSVWALAYPFGDAGSVGTREIDFAGTAGYECAFLNFGGCVNDLARKSPLALPRLHISASMEISEVEALVSGFDWSLRRRFGRTASQLVTQS
jgi:peptidoglycan/xylan/chitin deacetylase (PgdA/CDA1 family)